MSRSASRANAAGHRRDAGCKRTDVPASGVSSDACASAEIRSGCDQALQGRGRPRARPQESEYGGTEPYRAEFMIR